MGISLGCTLLSLPQRYEDKVDHFRRGVYSCGLFVPALNDHPTANVIGEKLCPRIVCLQLRADFPLIDLLRTV